MTRETINTNIGLYILSSSFQRRCAVDGDYELRPEKLWAVHRWGVRLLSGTMGHSLCLLCSTCAMVDTVFTAYDGSFALYVNTVFCKLYIVRFSNNAFNTLYSTL